MNINYNILKMICNTSISRFESAGQVTQTPDGIYIHKDNNASILGVAHLDTVLDLSHFYVNRINGDDIVLNAQLDDRLGVYTLLSLLPSMGLTFDVLLTEGEEMGRSTAAHFQTDKQYNWIFSFDRRGEGVVLYQYNGKQWESALKRSQFKIDMGSFSDISSMDHMGVKCVNVGTGYHGEHNDLCYASMNELKRQVTRFAHFYHANKDTRFEHTYTPLQSRFKSLGSRPWDDDEWDGLMCCLCKGKTGTMQILDDSWVCGKCWNDVELCTVCNSVQYNYDLTDGICIDCLDEMVTDDE